ncbi:PaaX family transcriptional regulator C-terminal domain-containing protein [Streptomyces sp. TR06-5]|uniref:PaaX family transcriptional regulator C-terminal domain-containing protein n=1 Tax=unclassified Streptomyces TaxID=2593676 RepID=UPI0039A091C3
MNDTVPGTLPQLRPLTARSIVLSTLLGHHPPRLPARALVRVGELFGVAEGTVRVALSRMVAAGDLDQDDRGYGLTARLLDRQARQDESRAPRLRPWRGDWELAVAGGERRPAAERAALRRDMARLRLAELREGTWLRPANLDHDLATQVGHRCTVFTTAVPADDPLRLAGRLWDLGAWSRRAHALVAAMDRSAGPAERFTLSAAALRHLLTDPLLPDPLLPGHWPGEELRRRYDAFENELAAVLRGHLTGGAAQE